MFLRKLATTSNGSRKIVRFTSNWFSRKSFTPLSYRKKWLAGRSTDSGRIVIRTKQSTLRRVKLLKINYSFRLLDPGFVSTFKLVPVSSKLLALVFYPSGGITYLPASIRTKAFGMLCFKGSRKVMSCFSTSLHNSLICFAPLFRKVSNLELIPGEGMKYARSEGSHALIVRRSITSLTAVVKLPSGVRKTFSIFSILILAPSALKWKKRTRNTSSGFWRSYGYKSQVRGVAMNPVDHPHGGRTKAIKYPRTPWGKTTKFK